MTWTKEEIPGDGWNASGQTPYYELILYLVVPTPSISTYDTSY